MQNIGQGAPARGRNHNEHFLHAPAMRMRLALLLHAVSAAISLESGNATSYWIVTTSESRVKDEALYMTSSTRSEGALRGWPHENDLRSKFHIIPAKGAADTFYLVATSESRKPGFMVYLSSSGIPEAWPWDPAVEDPQAQWRLVESDISSDGPSYFIVSTEGSREPNEVLFFNDFGKVDSWAFAERDDKCLWRFLLAPPSPPLKDAAERIQEYTSSQITGVVLSVLFILCCCACGFSNRREEQRRRTRERGRVYVQTIRQVSSGRIVFGRPIGESRAGGAEPPTVEASAVAVDDSHAPIPVVSGIPVHEGVPRGSHASASTL